MNTPLVAFAATEREEQRVPRPVSLLKLPYLRAWRVKKLHTQLDVAAKASVGISTIVRAEKGGDVGALTAEKLAQALDLTVEQLKNEKPA
jgi:DNA-binding XRE family transcriptional regulator